MRNLTLMLIMFCLSCCTSVQQISGDYTKESNSVVNATDYDKVESPRKERIEKRRRKLYHKAGEDLTPKHEVPHDKQKSQEKSKKKYTFPFY